MSTWDTSNHPYTHASRRSGAQGVEVTLRVSSPDISRAGTGVGGSALFGATGVVHYLGNKQALASGAVAYCVYVLCFGVAALTGKRAGALDWAWALATFGAALGGVAAGWLWVAQAGYMTVCTAMYTGARPPHGGDYYGRGAFTLRLRKQERESAVILNEAHPAPTLIAEGASPRHRRRRRRRRERGAAAAAGGRREGERKGAA